MTTFRGSMNPRYVTLAEPVARCIRPTECACYYEIVDAKGGTGSARVFASRNIVNLLALNALAGVSRL
jgi:hypothetical protein